MWMIELYIECLFRDMRKSETKHSVADPLVRREERKLAVIQAKAREHIRMFLGEYNAFCYESKYVVFQKIIQPRIFERKSFRQSFLQEILRTEKMAQMKF